MRVGFGYDVHPLKDGGKLVIGGVVVSEEIGVVAHSDGDVLCHAIIDAILGASLMGDIGRVFPEKDYEGMNSLEALKSVVSKVKERGYEIVSVDSTVVVSKPRLAGFARDIRSNLVEALGCESVSVKFKSGNGVGDVGSGKAIEAFAVVLMRGE